MWRAFFLAVGITLVIVGAECLMLEKVVLASGKAPVVQQEDSSIFSFGRRQAPARPAGKEIQPPEWAPWSLMAAGAVVLIYSFTIPKRVTS